MDGLEKDLKADFGMGWVVVGFYSFNSTILEETFDNAVSSLSTNTGGICQFYL